MDRYSRENAINLIEGYYNPLPSQTEEKGFVEGKKQLIENLLKQIEEIKLISFDDFKTYHPWREFK